jgi:sugar lactone lactonase YvrE
MKHSRHLICVLLLPFSVGAQAFGQQIYNYSTFAGTVGSTGSHNATGTSATFDEPIGIAVDSNGNVYVADKLNSLIREISSSGAVTTLAGSGAEGHGDGTGTGASFFEPQGVAVDSMGNVFVADTTNNTIRRITPGGSVSTYAGIALSSGLLNSNTVATAAKFSTPDGVAVDSVGNVYVADTGNSVIRKIAPGSGATVGGVVTTYATGFTAPQGIAVDSSGVVYVADTGDSVIAEISTGGVVSVLAGSSGTSGTIDGTGTGALFATPVGIAVDGAGNLFVGDTNSETIRKVTQAGVVTTIGGVAHTSTPFANGTDSYAIFDAPEGVAATSNGTLFVADALNEVIREGVTLTINGDFLGNGNANVIWTDMTAGDRGVYIMNGTTVLSWADLGTIDPAWRIAAVADFQGNGSNDILWENSSTGVCGFWTMSGTAVTGWIGLATVPTQWRIAGVGNFHGTGSNDILWENTSTGECGFYNMSGTTITGWTELTTAPPEWQIAGVADFNGDGKPDILWQNTSTGVCGFYIMNGTAITGWAGLGTVSTQWRIAAVGDFNGDGFPDILWQNSSTGVTGFYIMNNTTVESWVGLVQVGLEWQIQPE